MAAAMGADAIELDVRRSRAGRLLIHHDPLPAEFPSGEDAPLDLAEALDACAGVAMVNVELKNDVGDPDHDPTMAVVVDTIAALRRWHAEHSSDGGQRRGSSDEAAVSMDRWLLSSFSRATIDACRAVAPEIPTGWLVVNLGAVDVVELAAAGHRAVHPWDPSVTASLVDAAHDAGLAVNVWTCNDPKRLLQLEAMGVDGVCTDVPDLALSVLGRG